MTTVTVEDAHARPLRILLVDDDDAVRGVIERVLVRLGHAVRSCASSEEARAASAEPFEVAVVDLNLGHGGDDGWALLEQLRRGQPEACFVLTSGARPPLRQAESSETLFLKKPFSRGDLVDLLETARARLSCS